MCTSLGMCQNNIEWCFLALQPFVPLFQSDGQVVTALPTSECTCLKLSHPEIDKLRREVNEDLISLPMISALCNDKELLQTSKQCTCNNKPISPRPKSWHCDSNPVFRFPSASVNEHIAVAQVCRWRNINDIDVVFSFDISGQKQPSDSPFISSLLCLHV